MDVRRRRNNPVTSIRPAVALHRSWLLRRDLDGALSDSDDLLAKHNLGAPRKTNEMILRARQRSNHKSNGGGESIVFKTTGKKIEVGYERGLIFFVRLPLLGEVLWMNG